MATSHQGNRVVFCEAVVIHQLGLEVAEDLLDVLRTACQLIAQRHHLVA